MKIPELLGLIEELVNNESLTKKERYSLASSIKKQYGITMKDLRYSGNEISIRNLRSLISPLIENYESVKDLNSINEVLQTMAEDYDTSYITTERDRKSVEKEKEKLYAVILGNPGTTIDGMSSEYIAKIIKRKLTEEQGINRDDIINVLNMQAKNMYLNLEDYQKLMDDVVVSYLTVTPNGEKFSNPKILEVFQGLASSYMASENFSKAKETYENALKIKSLKNTPEYAEIEKSYKQFLEFMIKRAKAKEGEYKDIGSFISTLTTEYAEQGIFVKGTRMESGEPTQESSDSYIMPVEDRIRAMEVILYKLKEINPDLEYIKRVVFPDDCGTFSNYEQIKIKGTNVSMLENFVEDNARIFALKDECIDKIKPLSRWGALRVDGVIGMNHTEGFDKYCDKVFDAVVSLMRQTQKSVEHNEGEVTFDDTIPTIPNIGVEVPNQTEGRKIDEDEGIDKVEVERRKAHENREEVHKLEQELENIQRTTNEKIAQVKKPDVPSQE